MGCCRIVEGIKEPMAQSVTKALNYEINYKTVKLRVLVRKVQVQLETILNKTKKKQDETWIKTSIRAPSMSDSNKK